MKWTVSLSTASLGGAPFIADVITELIGGRSASLHHVIWCRPSANYKHLISVNPLECKGNYGSTSNNIKLVHWPLMGEQGCYISYSEEGTGWAQVPSRCTKDTPINPPTASVQITVLLYNGALLCGFNVPNKGLNRAYIYLSPLSYSSSSRKGLKLRCKMSKWHGCWRRFYLLTRRWDCV